MVRQFGQTRQGVRPTPGQGHRGRLGLERLRRSRLAVLLAALVVVFAISRGVSCRSLAHTIDDMAALCGPVGMVDGGEDRAPSSAGDCAPCMWCLAALPTPPAPFVQQPESIVHHAVLQALPARPQSGMGVRLPPVRGPPARSEMVPPTVTACGSAWVSISRANVGVTPVCTHHQALDAAAARGADQTIRLSSPNSRVVRLWGATSRTEHAMHPAMARAIGDPLPGGINGG